MRPRSSAAQLHATLKRSKYHLRRISVIHSSGLIGQQRPERLPQALLNFLLAVAPVLTYVRHEIIEKSIPSVIKKIIIIYN